jgi:nucleoside-diphosphate kinase
LKLIDYADDATRKALEKVDERTVCVLSPALYDSMGSIIELVESAGYTLVDLKSTSLIDIEDMEAAAALMGTVGVNDLARPEPLVAMSFKGANSIAGVCKIIRSSPYVGLGCPSNAEEMTQFANFFLMNRQTTATFEECTCCVIKPSAITGRHVGCIIESIVSRGFVVTAIQMFRLERAAAAEFLEVYDGVVPEYKEMVNEMVSGPVIALEIRMHPSTNSDDNIVDTFRYHAGPWDENMAREVAPESIRGMFGNLIHCTDLPKDGIVEVEYFFKILTNAHYIDGWK